MKAFDMQKNKRIDSEDLTDSQQILLEEVNAISLEKVKKAKGSYFIWACIPESQKVAMKSSLVGGEALTCLIQSINETLKYYTKGKVKLAFVQEDEKDGS